MKLYQFFLLFTFCSVLINAYSINGDIPLQEKLRKNVGGKKEELCINIPGLGDEYVTDCRYRHDRQRVYCNIKGKKDLYAMIPIRSSLTSNKNATELTVKEWYITKKEERSDGGHEWNGVNEIMETGWFEKVEAGDTYHGSYCISIYGDKRDFFLYYDKIVISKY